MEATCKGKFLPYCLIGCDAVWIDRPIKPFKAIFCSHLKLRERRERANIAMDRIYLRCTQQT
jgi:hypothetical protein